MGKYIEYLYFNKQPGERYYISADYANSAIMSTIASSYSFDKPIELWDDFFQITIDHPFKYSSQPVTSLSTTAVKLLSDAETVTGNLNVYDAAYNVISTSEYKIHSMPSYEFNHQYNSHFTESIYGQFRQTASVSEQEADQQWVIPVKFKIGTYFNTCQYWHLDVEYGSRANVWADDGWTACMINPGAYVMQYRNNYYKVWGTTVPAVLFRDAGIANIPIYNASNTAYQLNVDIFTTLGNVGHKGDVTNNEFVKFMNNLQNLSDCEIVSGAVKANTYASTSIYYDSHAQAGTRPSVKNYRVLSANVTDSNYSIGTITTTSINALKYAFYDVNRNYLALNADSNDIYDEYTYYCVMPTSAYSTSAAATAAIQNIIDGCSYDNLYNVNDSYSTRGTIQQNELVFNFDDRILLNHTYENHTVSDGYSRVVNIVPVNIEDPEPGVYTRHTVTAVRADALLQYDEIETVITKPSIVTTGVKQISTTSYTYSFGEVYVVNSAFTAQDSNSNNTIYKSDVFNMIVYSSPEIAPIAQCNATYAGYDTLCSMYYTPCDTVFRSVRLPVTTERSDRHQNMIQIATTQTTTTTTHFTDLPTRDIYFCITMSK